MKNSSNLSVLISSLLGTFMCWYDFFIFGIATTLVFKTLFFPDHSFLIPMLVFAVGFLSRPLGSFVWGFFADRVGRKPVLVWTMAMTGISTVIIGLLPTYADIGVTAAVILVAMRIFQTFALGGEFASASTILAEYNQDNPRRGFITGLTSATMAVALLCAGLVFKLVSQGGPEWFMEFGWRIPFLLSAVLVFVGVYVRLRVLETPVFDRIRDRAVVANPVVEVFRKDFKKILLTTGAYSLSASWMYMISVFGFAYWASALSIARPEILSNWNIATVLLLGSLIVFAWIGDKISRINMFFASGIISLLSTYTIIGWMAEGQLLPAMTLSVVVIMALQFASSPGFFTEIYPDETRTTGSGISLNLGALLGGGVFPLIAQWVFETTKDINNVAHLLMALTVISLGCLIALRKDQQLIRLGEK